MKKRKIKFRVISWHWDDRGHAWDKTIWHVSDSYETAERYAMTFKGKYVLEIEKVYYPADEGE